jgi:FkbM family methyltransferase
MKLLRKLRHALRRTVVVTEGQAAGLKLSVRRADPAFARGTYEAPMQEAIGLNLRPGDVFYDVGANIGFFSLIAARCVGPAGRAYAFEPVPENARAIRRSARLNGMDIVEVFVEAVGATTGRSKLMLADHIGGAMLASAGMPPDVRAELHVRVTTLDEAIASRELRPPSLVKIDVEGAEMDVLTGMSETLRVHRPKVIYEVDGATAEEVNHKASEIAARIRAAGYVPTTLPPSYPNEAWQVGHVLARPAAR